MFVGDLFENTGKNITVIYPGRFMPPHKGHKAVYDHLCQKYGAGNVYIVTSDKTDNLKSPFNFAEKRKMWTLMGVNSDKVIMSTQPYRAMEIVSKLDPSSVLMFAISEKDMAEDPRFQFAPKKDGSPSYFQPFKDAKQCMPLSEHAYMITVPTFEFTVLGKPANSASQIRAQFGNADEETKKKIVADLFGKFDPVVYNIMNNKLLPVPAAVGESVVEGTGLSPDTLASYKKKAGADASAADARGDFAHGDKRFRGIVNATKKEFDNDAKITSSFTDDTENPDPKIRSLAIAVEKMKDQLASLTGQPTTESTMKNTNEGSVSKEKQKTPYKTMDQHTAAGKAARDKLDAEKKAKDAANIGKKKVNELSSNTLGKYKKAAAETLPKNMHQAGNRAQGVAKAKDKIHDMEVTSKAKAVGHPMVQEADHGGVPWGPVAQKEYFENWHKWDQAVRYNGGTTEHAGDGTYRATGIDDGGIGQWDEHTGEGWIDLTGESDLEEGRFVKGPGGVPLDRHGDPIEPKVPKIKAPAPKKLTLDDVWRKVEEVVGNIYPDGDPIDWMAPWFKRQGIEDFKVGNIIDRAARKNGYKDMYDYWKSFGEDTGYNSMNESGEDPRWELYAKDDEKGYTLHHIPHSQSKPGEQRFKHSLNGKTVMSHTKHYPDEFAGQMNEWPEPEQFDMKQKQSKEQGQKKVEEGSAPWAANWKKAALASKKAQQSPSGATHKRAAELHKYGASDPWGPYKDKHDEAFAKHTKAAKVYGEGIGNEGKPRPNYCPSCHGGGIIRGNQKCPACNGTGRATGGAQQWGQTSTEQPTKKVNELSTDTMKRYMGAANKSRTDATDKFNKTGNIDRKTMDKMGNRAERTMKTANKVKAAEPMESKRSLKNIVKEMHAQAAQGNLNEVAACVRALVPFKQKESLKEGIMTNVNKALKVAKRNAR